MNATETFKTTTNTADADQAPTPEVAPAATQQAGGSRPARLVNKIRTVAKSLALDEIGMTVPYRDAPR